MHHELHIPQATVPLERTRPSELIPFDHPLGYFASSPKRLTAHIALAAFPETVRTYRGLAEHLIDSARPAVSMTSEAFDYFVKRIMMIMRPDVSLYTEYGTKSYYGEDGVRIGLNGQGKSILPVMTLLASRWLVDHTRTERLLPMSVTRPWLHGTRLAFLQQCLKGASTIQMARLVGGSRHSVVQILRKFDPDLLYTSGNHRNTVYTVTDQARPAVMELLSQIHGFGRDPGFSHALLQDTLPGIVDNPIAYGALARSALADIVHAAKSPISEQISPYSDVY